VDLNGEIVEVDQEYVEQWVSEHSEPTSSKLPQSA
jgi:hypothetical protein